MKNKYIRSFLITIVLLIISYFIYLIEKKSIDEILLSEIVDNLNRGFRVKQIIAILFLYGWGWVILKTILKNADDYWYTFLSFPIAVAAWCILSHVVLLAGIPYTFVTMIICTIGILALCFFLMRNRLYEINLKLFIKNIIYLVGMGALATSGIFPITMSSDSYHFIMQLGQMIVKKGSYNAAFGHMLVETAQAPALMAAIPALFGFENIFGMHHVLMLSFLSFFGHALYKGISETIKSQRAKALTLSAMLLLMGCRSVFLLFMWPISSTYWMVYATIFIICVYEIYEYKRYDVSNTGCLLELLCLMLCMLRGEGAVIMCFFLACLCTINISSQKLILTMNSCIIVTGAYYAYVYFGMGIKDASMLTPLNMLIIFCGMIAFQFFLVFFRDKWQKYIYFLIWIAIFALNLAVLLIHSEQYFYNIKIAIQNYTDDAWGIFPWILLCVMAVIINNGEKSKFACLYIVGGILLNFTFYAIRFHPMRLGIGDSFNRIIIASMPSAIYLILQIKQEP